MLVAWIAQVHMQYLHIGAGIVFATIQQCDFYCVWVLGNWYSLDGSDRQTILEQLDTCSCLNLCFMGGSHFGVAEVAWHFFNTFICHNGVPSSMVHYHDCAF